MVGFLNHFNKNDFALWHQKINFQHYLINQQTIVTIHNRNFKALFLYELVYEKNKLSTLPDQSTYYCDNSQQKFQSLIFLCS